MVSNETRESVSGRLLWATLKSQQEFMPVRSSDPFAPRDQKRRSVNPFVGQMVDGIATSSLPVIAGEGLRGVAGRWRERLANSCGQLVLEIGCHKGKILVAMAASNPADCFVGMDITYKRVVTSAQRLNKAQLNNASTVLANAMSLRQLFGPGELDSVVIFFPDPWPKARHEKNRLLASPSFAADLMQIVRPGGRIWFKTDSFRYYFEAEVALLSAGFRRVESTDRQGLDAQIHTSTFESHFTSLHQPVADVVFKRPEL